MSNSVDLGNIKKGEIFFDEKKIKGPIKTIQKELDVLDKSFSSVGVSLNKLMNQNVIKKGRVDFYKGLVKKVNMQALAAKKLKASLDKKMEEDMYLYSIQLLDKRILELEKKIKDLEA